MEGDCYLAIPVTSYERYEMGDGSCPAAAILWYVTNVLPAYSMLFSFKSPSPHLSLYMKYAALGQLSASGYCNAILCRK